MGLNDSSPGAMRNGRALSDQWAESVVVRPRTTERHITVHKRLVLAFALSILTLIIVTVVAVVLSVRFEECGGGGGRGRDGAATGEAGPRGAAKSNGSRGERGGDRADEEAAQPWRNSRLPGSVRPRHYDLRVAVNMDNFTFTGDVSVELECVNATRFIVLHADRLEVERVSVTAEGGGGGRPANRPGGGAMRVHRHFPYPATQMYVVVLHRELKPARLYRLNVSFSAAIEDDLLGFFRSSYTVQREKRTVNTSELHQFLILPKAIGNNSDICTIFNNYNNTPAFLETEDVPDDVKTGILPCVWPLALSSSNRSEVDSWFNLRLKNYLRFLSKSLISPTVVQNASCLAFQKLVSVMGNNFTYSSDFEQSDVYTTISSYLGNDSQARCYNASDAEQNSTAWFVNYIGGFVQFITVEDLTTFISDSQTELFFVNEANLELFNNTNIPEDVTDYYISKLFEFNVAAALASNIQTITTETFESLGSATAGLSSGQIASVAPSVLISSLSSLGSVSTWNQEQSTTIIQAITASGFMINNASSLESLGSLIAGVPSESIEAIPASELSSLAQSSSFVSNMLTASTVVQQTFVQQIISLNTSSASVVQNIPDAMATEIPPSLLLFSSENVDVDAINKKEWTSDQAAMFFETLDGANLDTEELNPSVLQGFTCTSVKKMGKSRIRGMVRACRPRKGRKKVQLKEPQLSCMSNLVQEDLSQKFTEYPSDMLLYINSKDVQSGNCRSYLTALGAADFSVASAVLNKDSLLLNEAKTCLGISGVELSKDNVEVLGNMACTLDGSYIEKSDHLILEKLKACNDLSSSQVDAIEAMLMTGETRYGEDYNLTDCRPNTTRRAAAGAMKSSILHCSARYSFILP
ncbi:Thyrotropin-releasing hormone-degrading ectoenzyme [Liparis tanakae]|uniref:Thyrotropin-releasing hormone-degrading ectoenzyme n=1 Tax=Liparis tanakae TaxID=230148 RepID=A0A4Z2HY11_9TELE|nr:Thyrotropin-releasing hormone-degrading ectoenzyme [Liparis tanakae]